MSAEPSPRTLVTGATGLLGPTLLARLEQPRILTREPERARAKLNSNVEAFAWSPEAGAPPAKALEQLDAIVHLAGHPVAERRWSTEEKRRIRDSRVIGTRNLVAGLANQEQRPRVLVSASAIGYYGDRGDETLDEHASRGDGFLADVCAEWEQEAKEAERLGVRVVSVRIGVVLARDGGALAKMLTPFQLGVGGKLGDGRQWMPWVHLDDVVGLLLHARDHEEVRGPVNAVSPNPVTNAEFTRALGRALHRPTLLTVPAFALRLALGEMSEVLTASARVTPRVATESGYRFRHETLGSALESLFP